MELENIVANTVYLKAREGESLTRACVCLCVALSYYVDRRARRLWCRWLLGNRERPSVCDLVEEIYSRGLFPDGRGNGRKLRRHVLKTIIESQLAFVDDVRLDYGKTTPATAV